MEDNGVGMTEEKVESLARFQPGPGGHGYGLYNVNKRLQLLLRRGVRPENPVLAWVGDPGLRGPVQAGGPAGRRERADRPAMIRTE